MATAKLQFGNDSGIVVSEYLEKYSKNLNLKEITNFLEHKLDEDDLVFDLESEDSIELIDYGESLGIFLQINWSVITSYSIHYTKLYDQNLVL